MKELKFSLKLKEVPVNITDVDGNKKSYMLKELGGDQRDVFLDDMASRMDYDEKGNPKGIKKVRGLQSGLLAMCLHDEKGKPVSQDDLANYPSQVLTELFQAAQTLSGLDKAGSDEAKNG